MKSDKNTQLYEVIVAHFDVSGIAALAFANSAKKSLRT